MGPYGFSLALGLTGLVVMAVLGFGHHGGDHAHHGGGNSHAGHVGHGHAGHGHAGHHGGDGSGHHAEHAGGGFSHLLALLSPRLLFSFFVGAGAAGLLADPILPEPFTALAAIAGGLLFERFLVGPVWKFLFRFESRPARMLESAVMEDAEAMMDFDNQGQGLVRIELDGQVVQLLGTLAPEERSSARRIRRGDLLRVEDVDAARNRCTVSYAGPRPPEALP
jgi:hypothetical protein